MFLDVKRYEMQMKNYTVHTFKNMPLLIIRLFLVCLYDSYSSLILFSGMFYHSCICLSPLKTINGEGKLQTLCCHGFRFQFRYSLFQGERVFLQVSWLALLPVFPTCFLWHLSFISHQSGVYSVFVFSLFKLSQVTCSFVVLLR